MWLYHAYEKCRCNWFGGCPELTRRVRTQTALVLVSPTAMMAVTVLVQDVAVLTSTAFFSQCRRCCVQRGERSGCRGSLYSSEIMITLCTVAAAAGIDTHDLLQLMLRRASTTRSVMGCERFGGCVASRRCNTVGSGAFMCKDAGR